MNSNPCTAVSKNQKSRSPILIHPLPETPHHTTSHRRACATQRRATPRHTTPPHPTARHTTPHRDSRTATQPHNTAIRSHLGSRFLPSTVGGVICARKNRWGPGACKCRSWSSACRRHRSGCRTSSIPPARAPSICSAAVAAASAATRTITPHGLCMARSCPTALSIAIGVGLQRANSAQLYAGGANYRWGLPTSSPTAGTRQRI